ncbi:glycosyltransferase [Aquiflexum gelatinilyticum]|uniref:Glucosyltransferase 3-like C-terminal domain-containing protein n=1 Tax=Aquiflexum gelatinilyticum TaxID=2961943 RepID=A0A9X2P5Z7_9BACT|nr:glycosyltransferase [Aquiflexum gelatinilyticum]MCR9015466.1 hypothetical protein [Aquiflexum gelatinilyticum]
MKKVLFLTPNSFPAETGGSVLFRKLIGSLDFLDFSWLSIDKSKVQGLNIKNANFVNFLPIVKSGSFDKIGRRIPWIGKFWFKIRYGYLKRKGENLNLKDFSTFDLIWVYVSTQAIPFSSAVFKRTKVKLHISVQDDIYGHLPKWEAKILEDDYIWLLKNATTIDFASEALKDYLFTKYNFSNRYKIVCFADETEVPSPILNNNISNIGFAGNVWSPKNFNTLLLNLNNLNKTGRNLKLHVFSNNFPKSLEDNFSFEIENRGLMKNEDLVNELQKMDLVYVPMSFEENKKILSSTSFPSKVFTYLNTGIPILFHAPKYSSVFKFIEKHNTGFVISSNDEEEFKKDFEKILNSKVGERRMISENAIRLLKNKYAFSNQRLEFIDLILN